MKLPLDPDEEKRSGLTRNEAGNKPGAKRQRRERGTLKQIRLALGMILVDASSRRPHAQDDVAAFFKGKVVRLVVGIGVGSGYDINARLLARYMAAQYSRAIRRSSCRTSRARAASP